MSLLRLFPTCCGHIFNHIHLFQKTIIHFIWIITIIINHTIVHSLLRFKTVHGNQQYPPINPSSVFSCNLMENIDVGYLIKSTNKLKKKIASSMETFRQDFPQ